MFVKLDGNRSRRRRHFLPQGSVLALLRYNTYANHQPVHLDTKCSMYAAHLCITTQNAGFGRADKPLSEALIGITSYYPEN